MYSPCKAHVGLSEKIGYDTALQVAIKCPDCFVLDDGSDD